MCPGLFSHRFVFSWLLVCSLFRLAQAQSPATATVIGRVIDAKSGKPLAFAAVFINATTKGTTTDSEGHYRLNNVPLGTVDLVASYLGYETQKQSLRLETAQPHTVNIALTSNGVTLADVTVKATKDKIWERQFRIFERELLGVTQFTNQCAILNGHVVSFDEQDKQLTAIASEPLLIENKALGYRITYNMQSFTVKGDRMDYAGTSRFEELTPANDREKHRWERNRQEAYLGSQRHLMASLVAGTLEQEGFIVYRINRRHRISTYYKDIEQRLLPITDQSLINPGRLPFERQLVLRQPICAIYTKIASRYSPYRELPYAYSEIELPVNGASFIEITTDGRVTKPNGMLTTGYQSRDRLATLLPQDWNVSKSGEVSTNPQLTEGTLLAPDRRLDSLNRQWALNHRYLPPQVFVQTDKSFHTTGDWVWLSGFMLDTKTHKLPGGTDALHLDFLSPGGKLIWHRWIQVTDGRFTDSFRLSDTLATGNYTLRAYTDADRFAKQAAFERVITVYNFVAESETAVQVTKTAVRRDYKTESEIAGKQVKVDELSEKNAGDLDVQLLPEGGRWVAGIPIKLGVKIIGATGRGVAITGRIVDAQGQELSQFATNKLGMGSILVTPKADQQYYAEVQAPGQFIRVALPTVEPEGIAMKVDAVSDSAAITIQVSGSRAFNEQAIYILAQSRGHLYYQQKVRLQDGKARLRLPTDLFPVGILHITLIDAIGQPRAERLAFIPEHQNAVQAKIRPDKSHYTPRERVALTIDLADSLGQHPLSFLSMAVTDAAQLPNDTTSADIRAQLLLATDIKGTIEQPTRYFTASTPTIRQELDNLLLTQGWRRLTWQKPVAIETADTLAGMSIAGQVIDDKNKPIAYAELLFTGFNKTSTFNRSIGADVEGKFRLGGLFFADSLRMVSQVMDNRLKPIKGHLIVEKPGEWFSTSLLPQITDWSKFQAYLLVARQRQEADTSIHRDARARQLKEVVVTASSLQPDISRRSSLYDKPDNTVTFDDKSLRYSNLYDMLVGRFPGVLVTKKQSPSPGYEVNIRGINSLTSSTQPLFLVDGLPIEDPTGDRLLPYNPADVERIDVLKGSSASMYGVRGGNGVIAFYTRIGKSPAEPTTSKGLEHLVMTGFSSVQREFYTPRYEEAPEANAPIDRRDVIYWKPLMQTDSQGKSVAAFHLSDVVRTIRIVLQGITADGRPVSEVLVLKVQ